VPRDLLVRRVLALGAVGVLGLALGLAGCGSADDGSGSSTSRPRGITGPPHTGSIATDTERARTATSETADGGDDYSDGGG